MGHPSRAPDALDACLPGEASIRMSHSDHAIWQMRFRLRMLRVGAMRIDRSFVGWGLFFIVVGAIPLAVHGGALTADQVARLVAVLAAHPDRRGARHRAASDAARGARRLAGRDHDGRDARQPARDRRRRHRRLFRRLLRPGRAGRVLPEPVRGLLRARRSRARAELRGRDRVDAAGQRLDGRGRGSDSRRSGDRGRRAIACRPVIRRRPRTVRPHRAAHGMAGRPADGAAPRPGRQGQCGFGDVRPRRRGPRRDRRSS